MKQEIKNLIFDVGGVIVLRERVDFSKLDRQFSLKEGTVENVVRTCFGKRMINKEFDEKSFFEENFSGLLNWSNYQKILKEIYEGEKVNKSLLEWIKQKRGKYKIFLLTNNTAALRPLLKEKFKIDHVFDKVFNSAEIGLAKPDVKLFKHLLKETNSSPNECLFVDDNPENIESARSIEFLTILFENNREFLRRVQELEI